jgi:arylsulfatase A-like enzyme
MAQSDRRRDAQPDWPTYRGFNRFYGFLEGQTNDFFPARIACNNMVAPIDEYPPGYYAPDDWMDKAINFVTEICNADPARPFFSTSPTCTGRCRPRKRKGLIKEGERVVKMPVAKLPKFR